MREAIAAYKAGEYTKIAPCARAYGLDERTLSRRMNGQVSHREAHTNRQALSEAQESLLVTWILTLESVGYAPSIKQVNTMAQSILIEAGEAHRIGKHWYPTFQLRNPQIRTKSSRTIDSKRVNAGTEDTMRAWYCLLSEIYKKYHFTAANTYNMDETGTAIGAYRAVVKVVGSATQEHRQTKRIVTREWCTIIECVNAAGTPILPLIIYRGTNVLSRWFFKDNVPDMLYTSSPNGWSNADIARAWIYDVFIPQTAPAVAGQYRLLVIDGHKTHIDYRLILDLLTNHRIIPVFLPPHTTHITQPLDVACFSPLKTRYKDELALLSAFRDGAQVKKLRFATIYKQARDTAFNERNIRAGFKATGIYPLSLAALLSSRYVTLNAATTPSSGLSDHADSTDSMPTPSTKRQINKIAKKMVKGKTVESNFKRLVEKLGKSVDIMSANLAIHKEQLAAQQQILDEHTRKSAPLVAVDMNKLVKNPDDIRKAIAKEDAVTAAIAARKSTRIANAARKATNSRSDPIIIKDEDDPGPLAHVPVQNSLDSALAALQQAVNIIPKRL